MSILSTVFKFASSKAQLLSYIAIIVVIGVIFSTGFTAGKRSEAYSQAKAQDKLRASMAKLQKVSRERVLAMDKTLRQQRYRYNAEIERIRNQPDTAKWLSDIVPDAIVRLIWVRDDKSSKRLRGRSVSSSGPEHPRQARRGDY